MLPDIVLTTFLLGLVVSAVSPNSQSDIRELKEKYKFGDLQAVNLDYGNYSNGNQDIHKIKEDRYNPGSFFLMIRGAVMKFIPGQPLTHLVGDTTQTSFYAYEEGNSSVAKFSFVTDLVQYNSTKLALADYLNSCIREYDYDTDVVRTIIGVCSFDPPSHGFWSDGDDVPGDSSFLHAVLAVQLVEPDNYFIMTDYGHGQLSVFNVSTQRATPLLRENQAYKVPNIFSILVNTEGSKLYVAYTYGIALIDLQTRQLTTLVGEGKFSGDMYNNLPLTVGSFNEAVVGTVNHLSWLVADSVLVGSGGSNKAVVVVNLVERTVLASCRGVESVEATREGAQDNCSLSEALAVTTTTNSTVYISTAESKADGTTISALYQMGTEVQEAKFGEATTTTTTPTKTLTTTTHNASLPNQLCSSCPIQVAFGDLVEVQRHSEYDLSHPIDAMLEDRYNPGNFLFNAGNAVMNLTSSGEIKRFLGNVDQRGQISAEGNSTTAKFALISGFLQYNETILLVGDYLGNCIREYNYDTDLVTEFIGLCGGVAEVSQALIAEPLPANIHFMAGVMQFLWLRKENVILTLDFGYQFIGKYKYSSHTIQLLYPDLKKYIIHPFAMLATSDEKTLYVVHTYALSSVDLGTGKVTKLIGEVVDDDGKLDIPFSAGPFSDAKIGLVANIQWLVRDQLLVTAGTLSNEMLMFFDLKGEQVYSACEGGDNANITTVGELGSCKLNSPTTVTVSQNRSIYVATLVDYPPSIYKFYSPSALYKMQIWVSSCEFIPPTGSEIAVPDSRNFTQYEKVTIGCPRGMALASRTKKRLCEANSRWNSPLPHCVEVTSSDIIEEVKPRVGQLAGGTSITVTGFIPDVGLDVHIVKNGAAQTLLYHQGDQRITFTMPRQHVGGPVKIVLTLAPGIQGEYNFEYLGDPEVEEIERAATLSSGGFDVLFRVTNINSSESYELKATDLDKTYSCVKEESMVRCDIGSFPNVTNRPIPIRTELLSNGERIKHNDVIIYPDPQFDKGPVSLQLGDPLRLQGRLLDIGVLRTYYNISIRLSEKVVVACLLLTVESTAVTCQPNIGEHLPDSEPKRITILIGDLEISQGDVVFLPTTGSTDASTQLSPTNIGIITASLIALVIVVICVATIFYRRHVHRHQEDPFIRIYKEDDEWFIHINIELKARLDPLLIEPDSLKLKQDDPIGEGNFGKIYLGQLYHGHMVKTVAVKTLKEMDTPITVIEKFLEEAVILEDFSHANVLPTLAVCIPISDKPQVVLPYMANGDLKSLLQMEHLNFTLGDLMHFAKQVACGMEYLAKNKFIHRDLAARNCLVSDKYIVRIADFGLSRDVYNKDYYRRDETSGVALPIKWLAIESLRTGVFSTQSDVWAYGVLVWELLTRGSQPYSDVDPWDIKPYLEEGRRLHQPKYCPPNIWEMMSKCWLDDPEERPTFITIHDFLDTLLDGTNCSPQSSYSYIRDYTKDIPSNYVDQPVEVETKIEDYLVPVSEKGRKMNDYPPLPTGLA